MRSACAALALIACACAPAFAADGEDNGFAPPVGTQAPAPPGPAAADGGSGVAGYGARLAAIDADLAAGDTPAAQKAGDQLAATGFSWRGETIAPDPALIDDLRGGRIAQARRRIADIQAQLGGAHAAEPALPAPPDQGALTTIRRIQRERHLAAGGDSGGSPFRESSLTDEIFALLRDIFTWIGDHLRMLWEWIRSWFMRPDGSERDGASVMVWVLVVAGAVLVGVALLAWLRRGQRPAPMPAAASVTTAPAADADPRSRAADDWRRYAAELAAAGRWREAVRAWYHAVLVLSWRRGLLHHRTGRTNWEYAAALPGHWHGRETFIDLTRRFDLAWYGGQATPEETADFGAEAARLCDSMGRQQP